MTYDRVVLPYLCGAARDYQFAGALDGEDVAFVFALDLFDGHADIWTAGTDGFNESVALFLFIMSGDGHLGVLLDEACGDDACRHCDRSDTQQGDDDGHYLSEDGDRIDVTIAHSKYCGNAEPNAGECVDKDIGLSVMLGAVHAERSDQHQQEYNENR